jgi:hypothetical protein
VDARFSEVYSDPRFMTVPKKLKKVKIDDRFKAALKSKEFNLVQKVDKRGKRVDRQDNTMANFYQLDSDEKPSDEEVEVEEKAGKQANKYYDEEGKFKWDAHSSSSEDEEEEEDGEEDNQQEDREHIDDDEDDEDLNVWEKLDKEEEEALKDDEEVEVGTRLALQNMDWDNLTAVDILAMFSSLCKGDMLVTKVEIYPSLFGLEQMKNDTLYGPPKEVFVDDEEVAKKQKKKKKKATEDPLEIEEEQVFDQDQLRKYEIQKMKYYYAVIHCNTKATAEKLYNEYNNFEFELTNIRLNLAFIPDSLTFP